MKSGYIYILVHPSDPNLYKIGVTILKPEERLAQHNSNYKEYAGQIVKETGQKWELKKYVAILDTYRAEAHFWGATPLGNMPGLRGIEVHKMEWSWVQAGLDAAAKAGVRPPPQPLPDWVYAYTAWMNKRLEGRGIALEEHVRSKFGKATFRCNKGHSWRTRPDHVAEGEGCPQCGAGKRDPEEIWQAAKSGYLCLLVHPDKPGVIRIGLTYSKPNQWYEQNAWDDWEVHRHRYFDEPELAETLIWKRLGRPRPDDSEPINIDLSVAEQAFRNLIYDVHREIALREIDKEDSRTT